MRSNILVMEFLNVDMKFGQFRDSGTTVALMVGNSRFSAMCR
jgi:hypothetical protein